MSRQLPLDLPMRAALGRDSLIISDSNAMAMTVIDDMARWPEGKLILRGDAGAGKTHMASVWAGDVGARIKEASELDAAGAADLATGPLVVENLQDIAGNRTQETALFHLHNLMRAEDHPLLMTTTIAPARLPWVVADVQSRLQATTLVSLEAIDDTLLTMLLVKLFSDRQLPIKQAMVAYTVKRIPRSFAAVQAFVAEMDRRALAEQRKVNRALAKEVLDSDACAFTQLS